MMRSSMMTSWEIGAYLLGSAFAALSIVFGSYDPWWQIVGLADSYRGTFSYALSVFFLLVGHTISSLIREARSLNEMRLEAADIERRLRNSIPYINSLHLLDTSDDAFQYLETVLPLARTAKNTRLTLVKPGTYITEAGKSYEEALKKSIKAGLQFKDVICPLFVESAERLLSKTKGSRGLYDCAVLEKVPDVFLNFIVLTYTDGMKEVLLGWAITKSSGFEQRCIRIADNRVAEYFEHVHADLLRDTVSFEDWQSGSG